MRTVAKMGYQVVEFYAPYFDWTAAQAKDMRKLMDDLGIRCNSTHNNQPSFTAEGLPKATELNQILGSKYIVMASAGSVKDLDGWKKVADQLTDASAKLKSSGLGTGYHNHQLEFKPLDGKRPMESSGRRHAEGCHAATRRRHVHRSRLGPGGLDQGEPGTHPVDSL